MLSQRIKDQYKVTVGIECHVQLKTATKLFAAVGNDARDAEPNTLISHICLGMPGALPVLNEQAVELAMQAGFALGVAPQKFSTFDRKHYFYPDLPKGYQITQFSEPIILGGKVQIDVAGTKKTIRLTRAHLEEDAGKTTHPAGKDYSLVDLNRAGTPLLEIVSEPEITSAAEAKAYARELWLLMRYARVSDGDLYHGNMRFDVNVSVSKDPAKLGTRTETKNLNSFKSVEKAVEYEVQRQVELLEKGESIIQETRGWDDAKQKTISQRGKEEAHDYRYFPDPDIPPVMLTDTAIAAIESNMPVMPADIRAHMSRLSIDSAAIETILDEMPIAEILVTMINEGVSDDHIKRTANWLVTDVLGAIGSGSLSWSDITFNVDNLVKLADMVAADQLSSTAAKTILLDMLVSGNSPEQIAEDKKLLQVSDSGEIDAIVARVIADNPQAAADVKNGEMKAIGFLVGQVMKASRGQANPALAQKSIRKHLGL